MSISSRIYVRKPALDLAELCLKPYIQRSARGLEDQRANLDLAITRADYVHARVGYAEGPQIPDPRAPEWQNAVEIHLRLWQQIIDQQKASGGLAFAAYPDESLNWQSTKVDGVEIYNLFTNARTINRFVTFFDGLWSYRAYPDLMFANFFARPADNLSRWDQAIANTNRKLVAIAGNDAAARWREGKLCSGGG